MKKRFILSFISVFILGLGFLASCGDFPSTSLTSDSLGGWDDSWNVSWPGEDESTSTSHADVCKHRCLVCGKCLDDEVDKDYTGERCSDLNGRTSYTFNAADDKVLLVGGKFGPIAVFKEENYVGNFNMNAGCSINYVINSPEENVASFQVTVSKMSEDEIVTGRALVKVNGKQYSSYGTLPIDETGSSWFNYHTVTLGCVTLNKGKNTISLGVERDDVVQFNVRGINLISASALTLLDANNVDNKECTHQDEDGYCTDYDSNDLACLNKREDNWTLTNINGKDSRVIKKSDRNDNLWNDLPTEQCIGTIANDTSNARIAWAFTISEDSYIRFSLEHSTTGAYSTFSDVWNMTLNGTEMVTEGRTSKTNQSWTTYEKAKVGYFKAKAGLNVFVMKHKVSFGYNIRSLDISLQKGTLEISQAELN